MADGEYLAKGNIIWIGGGVGYGGGGTDFQRWSKKISLSSRRATFKDLALKTTFIPLIDSFREIAKAFFVGQVIPVQNLK